MRVHFPAVTSKVTAVSLLSPGAAGDSLVLEWVLLSVRIGAVVVAVIIRLAFWNQRQPPVYTRTTNP